MKSMTRQDTAATLAALGFSALEAEVYIALLEESPATGYRIRQLSRRPRSDTYKATESLAATGAIDVDESALTSITKSGSDDRVCQLQRRASPARPSAS